MSPAVDGSPRREVVEDIVMEEEEREERLRSRRSGRGKKILQ
jgi:hypothetical protein